MGVDYNKNLEKSNEILNLFESMMNCKIYCDK